MPLTGTECLWQCQPLKAPDQHLNGVLGGVHAPLFSACVATRGPCVLVCFTLYVCVQAASTRFAICVVRRAVDTTVSTEFIPLWFTCKAAKLSLETGSLPAAILANGTGSSSSAILLPGYPASMQSFASSSASAGYHGLRCAQQPGWLCMYSAMRAITSVFFPPVHPPVCRRSSPCLFSLSGLSPQQEVCVRPSCLHHRKCPCHHFGCWHPMLFYACFGYSLIPHTG